MTNNNGNGQCRQLNDNVTPIYNNNKPIMLLNGWVLIQRGRVGAICCSLPGCIIAYYIHHKLHWNRKYPRAYISLAIPSMYQYSPILRYKWFKYHMMVTLYLLLLFINTSTYQLFWYWVKVLTLVMIQARSIIILRIGQMLYLHNVIILLFIRSYLIFLSE